MKVSVTESFKDYVWNKIEPFSSKRRCPPRTRLPPVHRYQIFLWVDMNGNMHLTGFCSEANEAEKPQLCFELQRFFQTTESSLEMKAIKNTAYWTCAPRVSWVMFSGSGLWGGSAVCLQLRPTDGIMDQVVGFSQAITAVSVCQCMVTQALKTSVSQPCLVLRSVFANSFKSASSLSWQQRGQCLHQHAKPMILHISSQTSNLIIQRKARCVACTCVYLDCQKVIFTLY